jgi:N-methylhydantoinase A/oxoprolinase/acetone carboxylase beta subunit
MQASLYERARLDVGAAIVGPAIIEQFDATTLIPRSWSGRVDGRGNLVLARQ